MTPSDFERAYRVGYRAALGAAAAECRRRATALDNGGHEYTRSQDLAKCAVAITGLRIPGIEPAALQANCGEATP